MKTTKKPLYFMLVLILGLSLNLISEPACGQDRAMRFGISASVQSEQSDIILPIRSERLFLAPAFSIVSISDAVTDFGVGFVLRCYVQIDQKAQPYIGARFGALFFNPNEGASTTDLVFGPAFGGEYLFDDHFSVGIEAQVNIAISDKNSLRFGNPDGTNINTASAVSATVYF